MIVSDPSAAGPSIPMEFEGKYLDAGSVGGFFVERFFRGVGSLLDGLEAATALEVGCGAGHSTARLRAMLSASTSLAASDVAPDNVARARQVASNVPVTVESIYELDRPDNSIDLIFCLEVLEHLDDPATALAEIARVARLGAILSVPREPLWRMLNLARGAYVRRLGDTPGHIQHWSKCGFCRFVASRFDIQATATPLPWTIVLARPRTESSCP